MNTAISGPNNTVTVTDATFGKEVLQHPNLVVADFWAPWCGPCRMVAPLLEELAAELAGKVKIVKINVDENSETAAEYGVRSLPTMLFFKGGKLVDLLVGAAPKKAIVDRVNRQLGVG